MPMASPLTVTLAVEVGLTWLMAALPYFSPLPLTWAHRADIKSRKGVNAAPHAPHSPPNITRKRFIAALFAQEAGVNCWREVGGRF